MLPPTHPFVAYLIYTGYSHAVRGESPKGRAVLALTGGALLADVVDKPIWILTSLSGRTVAHSFLVALPVSALVWNWMRSRGRDKLGFAFALGYLAHLGTDVAWPLLAGAYEELGFLLWPVTPSPRYSGRKTLAWINGTEVTTYSLEAAVILVGAAVWLYDGKPGLYEVRALFDR